MEAATHPALALVRGKALPLPPSLAEPRPQGSVTIAGRLTPVRFRTLADARVSVPHHVGARYNHAFGMIFRDGHAHTRFMPIPHNLHRESPLRPRGANGRRDLTGRRDLALI